MELNKLLELYANLYSNRGSIGWTYQDSAILDHVREQIYSRISANEACQAGIGISGGISSASLLKR